MRIIAGELGGRQIARPKSVAVRPMADRFREALFSVINSWKGAYVLDVYAGSGAVGFEALSRGAAEVEAVEISVPVARVIAKNVESLGVGEHYKLHNQSVEQWLKGTIKPGYDLIVADPPYDKLDANVLQKLAQLVIPGGVLALSHSSRIEPPELKFVELAGTRKYGDSALTLYRRS